MTESKWFLSHSNCRFLMVFREVIFSGLVFCQIVFIRLFVMSIMSYTGGTILAMAGNDCVCIASDLRLGEQMTTIATNMKKVIFQYLQNKVPLISE